MDFLEVELYKYEDQVSHHFIALWAAYWEVRDFFGFEFVVQEALIVFIAWHSLLLDVHQYFELELVPYLLAVFGLEFYWQ